MAKHLYGYSSSYESATTSVSAAVSSSTAAARSLSEAHLSDQALMQYFGGAGSDSDLSKYMYLNSEALKGTDVDVGTFLDSLKRSSQAWYSMNPLAKRSRFESASNFSIYPQRPGEKDCAHYMLTRTCKFGATCKFDHPVWVPEGGIPNWKEIIPVAATTEILPERPGELDCPYFLKTQTCKYGSKCKFNHPKDRFSSGGLPERPSEPICAFYMKTGICNFGATCKFHHPKDIQIAPEQESSQTMHNESTVMTDGTTIDANALKASVSFNLALFYNSKGLPMRPGELDCPFYLKTGSCKYGATCRYNHPDRNAINPPAAAIGHPIVSPSAANLNLGVVSPVASIYQAIDPRLVQPMLGMGPTIYPQRPGRAECDYYMKTGECKFGETCKFHHPIDRSAIKLTLAGLPRREGAVHCPYYMKTGTCKFGESCKFDHPPPGEVMAVGSSQGMSTSAGDAEGAEA